MSNTVISFPVPPYSNPPIAPQNFQPSLFYITAISLGQITTVTTSVNNNYVVNQEVRLLIPNGYGSRGLNEQIGLVLSIPMPNQVILNINSTGVDPFINAGLPTKPQIAPVGDNNNGVINSTGRNQTGTFIPGSFINISPQI